MAISGNLKGMPTDDLLQLIARGQKSGVLMIKSDNEIRNVFFDKGKITGINSSRSKDRLGALLIRKGILSPDKLHELRTDQVVKDVYIGQLLVQSKVLTEEVLRGVLIEQVQEVLFDILSWETGDFVFEERNLITSETIIDGINTNNLLMESARRKDEFDRVMQSFPSKDMVFRVSGNADSQLPDKFGTESQILEYLKKPKSIGEILLHINATEFEIYSTLKKMLDIGVFERDEEAENAWKEKESEIKQYMERAMDLKSSRGFHEALQVLQEIVKLDSTNDKAKQMIKAVENEIIREARRIIDSPAVIPKIRRTFASMSAENFTLSTKESYVFSRIDGKTDVKSLKYLTSFDTNTLYVILHKLIRMGLVYLDKIQPTLSSGTYNRSM
jgi:hypothetical protein